MKQVRKFRVTVFLNNVEKEMIQQLEDRLGMSQTELLRYSLRMAYKKELPTYVRKLDKIDESEMTEERCGELGGKIVEENGIKYCVYMDGSFETKKPLSE